MLPDVALLEIFDFYVDEERNKDNRGVAHAGARVSKMAKRCFWVTTSPEFATLLHSQNTSEGDAGHLASLAHRHIGPIGYEMWDADNIIAALEHNDRICELDLFEISKFAIGKSLASNAAAIPGTDTSASWVR